MTDYSYEILDLLKKYDGDVQAALAGETSPQCLYAFSPLRENLLEWVEFETDSRVLQIGSDYGSVTGLLAKRAGEVVVLDTRDENLEVNRLRQEGCTNVRYIRGGFSSETGSGAGKFEAGGEHGSGAEETQIESQKESQKESRKESRIVSQKESRKVIRGEIRTESCFKEYPPCGQADSTAARMSEPFDYVILAGSLERHRKEDAAELLKWAAGFLKAGGKLIAAAENEMGVRYLMGAEKFEVSFLEAEFRGLFEELVNVFGGSFLMYYPVPDYRYPVSIYSDRYLPGTGDVTNISARLDGPGFWFGNEEEAMAKVCQNGVFTKFTNSFLGIWEKGNL